MTEQRKTKGAANEVDVEIGYRIREARVMADMAQEELGKQIGVTFQQIQKYERGTNCVKARTLLEIAAALGVHYSFLLPEQHHAADAQKTGAMSTKFANMKSGLEMILDIAKAAAKGKDFAIEGGHVE